MKKKSTTIIKINKQINQFTVKSNTYSMYIIIIVITQEWMNHSQLIIFMTTLAGRLFLLFELPNNKSNKDKQAVWFT